MFLLLLLLLVVVVVVVVVVAVFFCFFLLFTTVLFQWDFSHGKSGLLSPGKASCDRYAPPNLGFMLAVSVFL